MVMKESVASRWSDPRGTIAQRYKNNDYAYVLHAGLLFVEFLEAWKRPVIELKGTRILDYGCGTGRVARFLALNGADVTGYDPSPACINGAYDEEALIDFSAARRPKLFTSLLCELGGKYDIVVSINVLEHLTNDEFCAAINTINDQLVEGGECYLWVNRGNMLLNFEKSDPSRSREVCIVKSKKHRGQLQQFTIC